MPWRHQFADHRLHCFHAWLVEIIKRAGRHVPVELRSVGGQSRLEIVEHLLRQAIWIRIGLHHQRRHRADDRSLHHSLFAAARQIAHHFAAAGRMADMDRVFQVEMFGHRGQVVGIMVEVVTIGDSGSIGRGRAYHEQ